MPALGNTGILACGTLRREINSLARAGRIKADHILYTAPGLHERPAELERQFVRQALRFSGESRKIVVVFGEKCFLDVADPMRDTNALVAEQGPSFVRVDARNCVDMLASKEERREIAAGEKVYWLTPGWIENWDFIFKDWDEGKANETFPAHDKAVVLDGINYFDEFSVNKPERVLEIADWMKIPLEAHHVTLERLTNLVTERWV